MLRTVCEVRKRQRFGISFEDISFDSIKFSDLERDWLLTRSLGAVRSSEKKDLLLNFSLAFRAKIWRERQVRDTSTQVPIALFVRGSGLSCSSFKNQLTYMWERSSIRTHSNPVDLFHRRDRPSERSRDELRGSPQITWARPKVRKTLPLLSNWSFSRAQVEWDSYIWSFAFQVTSFGTNPNHDSSLSCHLLESTL